MGRRFLMILGMMLLALSTAPAVRGQVEDQKSSPPEPAPVREAPATFPANLAPPNDGTPLDGDRMPPPKTIPSGSTKGKAKKSGPPAQSDPSATGSESNGEAAGPPVDDNVVKAQATSPAAGQPAGAAPTAAAPDGATDAPLPTADRLPVGKKQSVAVTVDVQAPPSMNLNKDATLKLIIRNTGTADAFNVRVDDELPEGLKYVSSLPEMRVSGGGQHLSWVLNTLPGGSDRLITIKVTPIKTGPFDHVARVQFETGCKSRTLVLEPKLKVDIIANPTVGKVLKGQQVAFHISIHNTGDGPARNVAIQAKLSKGLKHESGPRGEEQMLYELSLPELGPNATETLDPLVADAILGGEQSCTVTASSDDVVSNKDEAVNVKKIEVVEPKLKLTLDGPEERYTDTVADYKLTVENPGTAPARKVRILATLPVSGKLVKYPPEARFDKTASKLYWTIDQIDPGAKAMTLPFQVRMGGKGRYEVLADAVAEGALKVNQRINTEVKGIADVDLVVSESMRVLDVGGETTFQIRLRNYGTNEATRLLVRANLSANLKFVKAGSASGDVEIVAKDNTVIFQGIDKLAPNKEILLGILVTVTGPEPRLATCRASVVHDDMRDDDRFESMAGVKVTSQRRGAAPAAAGQ
jgi:uncharacterized repeat protein (TIGR01451 family)